MILGIQELLRLVHEKKLVENLSERELVNPEGAGFDIRIGELYEMHGSGFLGVEERETPKMALIATYIPEQPQKVELKPHTYYLMKTIERVNVPFDLVGLMRPRTTLIRSGVHVLLAQIAPGYSGQLNFGLVNLRDTYFNLEMGARMVHLMFHRVEGGGSTYRGQWQGGRTTTDGREMQV